ncbi:MAG: hypothetical protein IJS29_08685 [Selenomonadaceae bacterium]|nr:hypothetical protein [Selenomonadaceae bacterium]
MKDVVYNKNLLAKLKDINLSLEEKMQILREHIPNEKILSSTDEWTDEKINEIIKDDSYSNAIQQLGGVIVDGKVTYPDEQTRKFIVKFLKSATNPSARFSISGKIKRANFKFWRFCNSKDLTEQHKLLQQFGESIGANVVFFNNYNKDFHGAYEGNIIYLNINSAWSLTQTFANELFHFLKANKKKCLARWQKRQELSNLNLQIILPKHNALT